MYNSTTLLANINSMLPLEELTRSTKELNTDRYTKYFTTKSLFLVLLTAQIKGWSSLRDIETGFSQYENFLYHLGLKAIPYKSTIADANARIDSEVFAELFRSLVQRVLEQHKAVGNTPKGLKRIVRAIDSTTIELALSLFDWAKFRTTKGAIKLHTTFNITSQIPEVVYITEGNINDTKNPIFNSDFDFSDSITIFDRGYHDFAIYNMINQQHGVFVTRLKKGIKYEVIGQQKSFCSDVIRDLKIRLTSDNTYPKYNDDLRLIEYVADDGNYYRFLTNNFKYSALTITNLYKSRWQIELFFKWIKQHLKIKTFFGTSRNAVMNQIWVALIYYTLIKYVMYQCNYKGTALELSRIFRERLFSRGTIIDYLKAQFISEIPQISNPLYTNNLFDTS